MPVRGSRTPFYSILTTGQRGGHYYTHFPEEEAEAQKSEVIRVYSRGWERGMCPHVGRPGSELHVDSAAVFWWENIYKWGLPSLLTPHSPYDPAWIVGPRGHGPAERRASRGQAAVRRAHLLPRPARGAGLSKRRGTETPGLSRGEDEKGRGRGGPRKRGTGRGRRQKMRRTSQREGRSGGEAGCNESESEKGSKEKGPRHREDLSLHGDSWSSQKSRGPSCKVVSSPSPEVCKQDCVDLQLRHPSEHLCLL